MRALLLVLAACGRIGFDAGDNDPPFPDAPELGAFGPAILIPELDVAIREDDDPTLPGDESEIFFSTEREVMGLNDIYRSLRVGNAWSMPERVDKFFTIENEITPELTLDGLTMYFSRARPGGGNHDIFMATRTTPQSEWSEPQPVAGLATEDHEEGAIPGPDHLTLVVSKAATKEAAVQKLYIMTRESTTAAWSSPMPIASFDIGSHQAWLGPTSIYFTFSPPGSDYDIYKAIRTTRTSFAAPVPVTELNTIARDADPWLSPNERRIYFSRDNAIYYAER